MMDDEDDVTYRSNTYASNGHKFPAENDSYSRDVGNSYGQNDNNDDDDDEDEDDNDEKAIINDGADEDEDDDDDDGGNGVQRISKDDYEYGNEDDNNDNDNGDQQRHPKKRKMKNLISSYEFAPRLPAPLPATLSAPNPKPSYGGRNPLTDWTEHETLVLLDAWGDRFLKHGRKSLRSEEWQEVAEKVSQESKIERTDTQCRNRLDTLKKKYKKEKMKFGDFCSSSSEWVYFKKMDGLLSSSQVPQTGLSCGIDSGEYVFMNPKVYLNSSNGLDEMRDSPGNSTEGEEDESEGLPPKKTTKNSKIRGIAGSFKMLANSFQKFSDIYERIEGSKRQQMAELEQMRMDFHRDLESQKREILERGQAEIAKIRQGEDEDNAASTENISG